MVRTFTQAIHSLLRIYLPDSHLDFREITDYGCEQLNNFYDFFSASFTGYEPSLDGSRSKSRRVSSLVSTGAEQTACRQEWLQYRF